MISQTFTSGNFNDWDHLVSTVLPAKNMILRQEIITTIDNVLLTMLGANASIQKTSIDATEICNRNSLSAVRFKLIYTVGDFNAPEAPKAAVDKDVRVITEALLRDDFKLLQVNIDINSGQLLIEYEAPIVEA